MSVIAEEMEFDPELIREKFAQTLIDRDYPKSMLERDEWGYIDMDIQSLWGGFRMGYILARSEG